MGRPSRSAWTRALTKVFTSGAVVRSPSEAKASPRDLPIWISERTRANSPPIGPVDGAGDLEDRGVEALTGLDADGEHVERVGQALPHLLLPLQASVVEEEVGRKKPAAPAAAATRRPLDVKPP